MIRLLILLLVMAAILIAVTPTPDAQADCVDAWGTPCLPPVEPTPERCGALETAGECAPGFATTSPFSCSGLPSIPMSIWGGMFGSWMLVLGIMGYLSWNIWRPRRRVEAPIDRLRQRLELEAKERAKSSVVDDD